MLNVQDSGIIIFAKSTNNAWNFVDLLYWNVFILIIIIVKELFYFKFNKSTSFDNVMIKRLIKSLSGTYKDFWDVK